MSRFKRLSHVIWHCQYHIVWVPKYRFRILKSKIAEEVHTCIQAFCAQLGCEIVEVNVQPDHVHLLLFVPPKVSISDLMGTFGRGLSRRLLAGLAFAPHPSPISVERLIKLGVFLRR